METIQIWIDRTEADRPYIVSRGRNGEDAPNTVRIHPDYASALAHAKRISAKTGLDIVDEVSA